MKIVNFPDRRLDQFVADLRREGFAIADLEAPTEVEPFRDVARRALRQLGIRFRTGLGDAMERDADGREKWTYGRRVWACDLDWQPGPAQKFRRVAARQRMSRMLDQRKP